MYLYKINKFNISMKVSSQNTKITADTKLQCKGCKRKLDHRIPRPALMKILLPWLLLKRYKCTNCLRTTYRNL